MLKDLNEHVSKDLDLTAILKALDLTKFEEHRAETLGILRPVAFEGVQITSCHHKVYAVHVDICPLQSLRSAFLIDSIYCSGTSLELRTVARYANCINFLRPPLLSVGEPLEQRVPRATFEAWKTFRTGKPIACDAHRWRKDSPYDTTTENPVMARTAEDRLG